MSDHVIHRVFKIFVAAVVVSVFVVPTHAVSETAKKPNIVLLYADDFGYTDLACQGSEYYETPNLDRFAKEGMVFTDGYAAAANCAPSRAALMSGAYAPRTGIYTVAGPRFGSAKHRQLMHVKSGSKLKPGVVSMAEALKSNGYQTCHIGKWHLGPDPTQHGFDINVGGHQKGFPRSYFSPYKNGNLPDGPVGEHLPDRLAKEACQWMEQKKDSGPFFVYLAFYSVHSPVQARYDLAKKYEKKPASEHHWDVKYAAMVEAMDLAVGDVLKYLDESGLADNTLVVFTSDNGPHGRYSNAKPLRGNKGLYYEGGVREPFFVRCPGVTKPGSINHTPVHQVDLYPTFL
ncbi:MAG: sulfatase, partial [Planctomycetota bacterium]